MFLSVIPMERTEPDYVARHTKRYSMVECMIIPYLLEILIVYHTRRAPRVCFVARILGGKIDFSDSPLFGQNVKLIFFLI